MATLYGSVAVFVVVISLALVVAAEAVQPDYCSLPSDTGPCKATFKRYYYNKTTDTCEEFTYGGCDGNLNRFESKLECHQRCSFQSGSRDRRHGFGHGVERRNGNVRPAFCSLPPAVGSCEESLQRYFYNTTSEMCEHFIYRGCHGNKNNFVREAECVKVCLPFVPPKRPKFCALPKTGPCSRIHSNKYFYNQNSGRCEALKITGCFGNWKSFDSLAECVQVCHAYLPEGLRVCTLPREPGPCIRFFPRYHYDAINKTCEPFIFGGCQGNDNRFTSVDECMKRCKGITPHKPPRCLMPVDPGPCKIHSPRYYFNAASQSCEQFVYGSCRGNKNRFETKAACEALCL